VNKRQIVLSLVCLASLVYGGLALYAPTAAQAAACCQDQNNWAACGSDSNWYCCVYTPDQYCNPDFGLYGWCYRNNCPENPN